MSRFLTNFWSKPETHLVGISAHGAAWLSQDQGQPHQWHQMIWERSQTPIHSVQALATQLRQTSTTPIAWIVAPSLLRHWLQKPPAQIQSLRELHAVTLARATQLFGVPHIADGSHAVSWTISGEWHASQAFVCAALPEAWQTALQSNASGGRHSVYSPLQLAMSKFKPSLPKQGWVALIAVDTLNLMYLDAGQLSYLRCVQLSKQLTSEQLQELVLAEWRRDMLRTPYKADHLHWLGLTDATQDVLAVGSEIRPIASSIKAPLTFLAKIPEGSFAPNAIESSELDEAQQAVWCALQCIGASDA